MPVHTLAAYLIEPYNIGFHISTFGDYITILASTNSSLEYFLYIFNKFECMNKMFITPSIWTIPVDTLVE
jgi:hypothetical protein